ncbi:Clavaminate synthase-like protein [Aspergillus indologenus CBS 114.80]|uniref:Clavaminate synthase-like protein n=1 Tax=Aspergillus indologenus CBS 114.80 TaxID=1450541 RepID=A0A2V5JA20_9EURO|nr:Clavaminate synthase-like protein [Aspergillus indologenus CBS 114.80]
MLDPATVPTIDLSLLQEAGSRQVLVDDLRRAIRDFGVFYVSNLPFDVRLLDEVKQQCQAFFDLPYEEKMKLDLANVPSFLGYAALGTEITCNKTDWREHLTVASEFNGKIEGPLYRNLLGPTQWPSAESLPDFAPLVQRLLKEVTGVATTVRELAAEAMGIDNRLLDQLFDAKQQYRGRMIKYPSPPADADPAAVQALGAHQDTAFATLICQLTDHIALQVQNAQGTWIDCPPVPGTVVYVVGKGAEAVTYGVCKAAWHRVIPPVPGSGPRYSIAIGTGLGLDTSTTAPETKDALQTLKEELRAQHGKLNDKLHGYLREDERFPTVGSRVFHNYARSYPEVVKRWFPGYNID